MKIEYKNINKLRGVSFDSIPIGETFVSLWSYDYVYLKVSDTSYYSLRGKQIVELKTEFVRTQKEYAIVTSELSIYIKRY